MKVRDIVKILLDDGWYYVYTEGSHNQFKHPIKPGKVTVAGRMSKDLSPDTVKSIWRQAQLEGRP